MKKLGVLRYPVAVVAIAVYILFTSPNLNPLYSEGAFFWAMVITIFFGLFVFGKVLELIPGTDKDGKITIRVESKSGNSKNKNIFLAILALPWAFLFLMNILSMPLFNSAAYRDQLAEPEVLEFSEEVQVVDLDNVPVVDSALAYKLADKKLGERASLGSQVYLGDPVIQNVNGELVWVVPLNHSGFFMWFSNMEGTPGYIVVSATNPNDVEYVEDHYIKYQPGGYFFDNIDFKARFSGNLFSGITDYSFELDDDGVPHWVVTNYKNEWLFSLPEAVGVTIINAETGEYNYYDIGSQPEWVDRLQPEEFIMNQINNKGEYVHGVFNFSNRDKYQTSQGNIIVYNEGDCYLFTGLTSVGADESTIGFLMVDMVTKEPIMYNISGATESSAQSSAEGRVQNLRYSASFPLIINLNGEPTYFMTLKDDEGLIKQYAYVNVKNYLIVGVGDTIDLAANDYQNALRESGSSTGDFSNEAQTERGIVERINIYAVGEVTYATIMLDNGEIYECNISVSKELPLTAVGDSVTIDYIEGEIINTITEFENNTI